MVALLVAFVGVTSIFESIVLVLQGLFSLGVSQ
jgi:hypothetical protein